MYGYRLGYKIIKQGVSSVANQPEVDAYLSGYEVPQSEVNRLNILVSGLKANLGITNLSDAFDCIWAFAGENAALSLKNLVKDSHHAGTGKSPTFVSGRGWQGGGGSYINTNYNPATEGANYTLNDASVGIFFDEIFDDGLTKINGAWVSPSSGRTQLMHSSFGINGVASAADNVPLGLDGGMKIVSRDSANTIFSLNDDGLTETDTASDVIPNKNLYLLALNYDNDVRYPDTSRLGFAFTGRHLTLSEASKVSNLIYTYMNREENNEYHLIAEYE